MGRFFRRILFQTAASPREAVVNAMQAVGYAAEIDGSESLFLLQGRAWNILCPGDDSNLDSGLDKALSEQGKAALTVTCCDSDYLLLELHRDGRSETASVGRPCEDTEIELQCTAAHWQPIVGNFHAWNKILDMDFVFAEEALEPLGSLLGFDAAQLLLSPDEFPEDAEEMRFRRTTPSALDHARDALLSVFSDFDPKRQILPDSLKSTLDQLTTRFFGNE